MTRFLKQSTQVKVKLGQFVDATDGVTPETGITLGAADQAELLKHDSGTTVDVSGNTWAGITGDGGSYNLTLTTSNTDTVGNLAITVADASVCRPITEHFTVIPAQVWNSLIGGTDLIDANASQIDGNAASGLLTDATHLKVDIQAVNGNTTAADNLGAAALGIVPGTVSTGSSVTVVTTGLTETTNDHYNGRTIVFTSGNLAGQAATITDYSGSNNQLTVSQLTEAPANGDTFTIV